MRFHKLHHNCVYISIFWSNILILLLIKKLLIFIVSKLKETAKSATSSDSSVVSSIKDNKVPYTFLIMFLIQFVLMIIDRALYLRKNRQGKFIFQVILVILVHVYVFFVLPFITKLYIYSLIYILIFTNIFFIF